MSYNVFVSNNASNAQVTAATITPTLTQDYGLNDVYTDETGRLYLWLPSGSNVTDVTAGGTPYSTLVQQAAAAYILPATANGYIAFDQELTAALSGNVTAITYQWYKFSGGTWTKISGANSQTFTPTTASYIGEIRVVINETYTSPSVTISANVPTFTVTIPETVEMTTTSFTIGGSVSGLLNTQSIDVTVAPSDGGTAFELVGTNSEGSLAYTLHPDSTNAAAVASGGKVASFNSNGSGQSKEVFFTIAPAIYSGAYTDTLTFTVSFNSGS